MANDQLLQIESGRRLEEVEVDLCLLVIKPIQAAWLVEMYNYLTSVEGRAHPHKGWEKTEIEGIVSGKK